MIVLLLAALIAAEPPAQDKAPADPPERSTAEKLSDLKVLYDQSCGAREYGAYDDLCEGLKRQITDYKRSIEREEAAARRAPHPASKPAAAPAPAPPPAATKPQA